MAFWVSGIWIWIVQCVCVQIWVDDEEGRAKGQSYGHIMDLVIQERA